MLADHTMMRCWPLLVGLLFYHFIRNRQLSVPRVPYNNQFASNQQNKEFPLTLESNDGELTVTISFESQNGEINVCRLRPKDQSYP